MDLQRYQFFLNLTREGFWDWDLVADLAYLSPRYCELTGYLPEETVFNRDFFTMIIHPEDRDRVFTALEGEPERGDALPLLHYRMLAKDGTQRYVEARSSIAARDPQGRPVRLVGTVVDVTRDRHAEMELREAKQLYETLFRLSPEIIALTSVKEGRYLAVNSAHCKATGYSAEELIGHTSTEMGIWREPSERERVVAQLREQGGVQGAEVTFLRRSGESFPTLLSMAPVDMGGEPCMICVVTDITSRKLAEARLMESERALRSSEERFRTIMALCPDIISILDADGVLVYNSPAAGAIHGYQDEDLLGRNTLELVHPEDQPEVLSALKRIMELPTVPVSTQYRYLNKDGGYVWMEATASNQLDNPLIKGIIAISRDISQRKRAEEERLEMERKLLHASKLESLGILAGGIAHDFNNIVTIIMGNAELAKMKVPAGDPVLDFLQGIEKGAARASELARQMLAYAGRGKLFIEPVNLNSIAEEMASLLEASIWKKVILEYHLDPDIPTVEGDATQIRQVVMNLIINASEAIGDHPGVISVTTGCLHCTEAFLKQSGFPGPLPEGLYVSLEVADTGQGMDQETMSRVFDPFFSTKFSGRGLGMAAVQGVVRGHKGAIRVSSELGQGSRITLLLPAGRRLSVPVPQPAGSDAWQGSGMALFVDDEESILRIGTDMLNILGFGVLTARSGREAIDIFKSRKGIDFVLLDLTMPEMDGVQCCLELRRIDPGVKVVVCSGYAEEEVLRRFQGVEILGFVPKPYRLCDLRTVVSRVVQTGPEGGCGDRHW